MFVQSRGGHFSEIIKIFLDKALRETARNLQNLTVQDVLNPANEAQRDQYKNLARRKMPYIENRHLPVSETVNTLAGIHINRKTGLGFLFRMFGGDRLATIYNQVHQFSLLDPDVQVERLKAHLISVGSQRSSYYNLDPSI